MENQFIALKSHTPENQAVRDAKTELEELSHVILDSNDKELIRKIVSLTGAYGAYERSNSSAVIEDIVAELAVIIRELLKNPHVAAASVKSSACGRSLESPDIFHDLKHNGLIYFEQIEKAFYDKLREDAMKKNNVSGSSETVKEPSTVRIYTTCIRNELLYENGEYNLNGAIDAKKIEEAIVFAIDRLKKASAEGKKIDKNAIPALKKLRSLLGSLMRTISEQE